MTELRFQFEVFEGPLDLLLHLVRKEEVDVYEVDMVDEAQEPTPGDDAADARFVPIADVLAGVYRLNGDHEDVLRAWLQP